MHGDHQVSGEQEAQIIAQLQELNHLKDVDAILDRVLLLARRTTGADAGSIFLVQGDTLRFSYVHNDTLFPQGSTDRSLYADFTVPVDETSVVGYVASRGETLFIDDAYALDPDLPYHHNSSYDRRTGYRTTSMLTLPLQSLQDRLVGVMQLINATDDTGNVVAFDEQQASLMPLLANHAATAIERGIMTRELILRMMKMAELRDPTETGAHVQRVGAYSAEIYKRWAHNRNEASRTAGREAELDAREVRMTTDLIRLAAMLHDVGKVGIPDAILKKPGRLDDEEFLRMKWHTVLGARLFVNATSDLDAMCHDIALNHHEKWAGGGYPGKVSDLFSDDPLSGATRRGQEIPLAARITGLADVYDALVSVRCYKKAWPEQKALSLLEEESGSQFDPEVVRAFLQIHDVILAIRDRFQDEPET